LHCPEAVGHDRQLRVKKTHLRPVRNFKDGGPSRDQRQPGRRPFQTLNFGLFCHFQCVVDLDPKVSHCTFKFRQ
jgi:hypothetical protein